MTMSATGTTANALKRGSLVVFEGCDRSGKSTQVKMLCDHLNKQNIKCKLMRFPDRTSTIGMYAYMYCMYCFPRISKLI